MRQAITTLPGELFRTITRDQGKEMAYHAQFTIATGIQVVAVALASSAANLHALAAVAGELCELGVKARAVPADLSDLSQIDPLIDRSEAVLGPIDLLVNNAGVEITSAFTSYTREVLTSMVDVNLTAPLLLTHRLVPGMLARERGHVVFISSAAGKLGPAYQEPYAATPASGGVPPRRVRPGHRVSGDGPAGTVPARAGMPACGR